MKRIVIIFAICLLTLTGLAQNGSVGMVDPYSTAFGKTYTINSRGIYALGINPANIALPAADKVNLVPLIPNLSLRAGTDFLSINEINYFGGQDINGTREARYLTTEDKQRLVNLFKDGGTILIDGSILYLGATWNISPKFGSIGFSVQDVFNAKMKVPAGIIELIMNGNPVGSEYSLNDTKFKSIYYRTYNLSYAHELPVFQKTFKLVTAGVSLKMLTGYAYTGLNNIDATIKTNADYSITEKGFVSSYVAMSPSMGVNYDFDSLSPRQSRNLGVFPKSAGSGVGFDLGFSAIINDKWSVGMAITDIGKIHWDANTAEYTSNSTFTLKDASDPNLRDSLKKVITGQGKFIDGFDTDLPTAIRLGASYIVKPDVWYLTADLNIGLNDAPRNEQAARFSIGGEWNAAKWLPYLRGGFSFGGADFFSWTVGFGLNIYGVEFNAATPDFQYIFTPKDGKRISFAGGFRILL